MIAFYAAKQGGQVDLFHSQIRESGNKKFWLAMKIWSWPFFKSWEKSGNILKSWEKLEKVGLFGEKIWEFF